jgi:hypothetical protein
MSSLRPFNHGVNCVGFPSPTEIVVRIYASLKVEKLYIYKDTHELVHAFHVKIEKE